MIREAREPGCPFEQRLLAEMPALRAFLRRLCRAVDLDDLVQEALARALRYRATYAVDRPLKSWLLRIAFRVYLDHRRRGRADAQSAADPRAGDGDAEAAAEDLRAEQHDRVRAALLPLSAVEREVLVRFHGRGESIADIVAATGLKPGTVKSHLHRARRRIAAPEERP